ncbi:anti-sigma factor [Pelomonas sp. SE-A7]|uniref:anti-sigma factor n=1 Tax=Pelomonas sp. SE-A7 TaxID=3054953 RepID=UPI00259D02D2|nr:anti-sigma factor [Pelomonas sp. SE-A7]MDM4765385.1 anti-sigma factor [Pelomonas sp. SE-A7]
MSTVIPIDRDPHAAVLAQLPWYARGQLDDAEMQELQQHLLACPACRAELETEPPLRSLLATMPLGEGRLGSADAGLARVMQRIQGNDKAPNPARQGPRWLVWTAGLQGGAIAMLLLMLVWTRIDPPAYRGLSGPAPATQAQALVIFGPEASERQMRAALQNAGMTLVGGPTESGAYVLRLPATDQKAALERLRRQAGVQLAEALDPGSLR